MQRIFKVFLWVMIGHCNFGLSQSSNTLTRKDATSDPTMKLLAGQWQGVGNAFGGQAQISMNWDPAIENQFMRISYRLDISTWDGHKRVFQAAGFYRPTTENRYQGTWVDTTGAIHPINAVAEKDALIANWGTPDTQEGMTRYEFIDTDTIEITDSVKNKEGKWIQFSKNTVKRIR